MATPLPLPLSSDDDMNIDDYFDFDAASCDPRVAPGWETVETETVSKTLSIMSSDESILERLLLDHHIHDDTYQAEDGFAGVYPESFNDHILEPATDFAWNDPEAYYYSDSDPRSGPGSPDLLSPPSSPISSGADDDVDFLADDSVPDSRDPSQAQIVDVLHELATTTIHSAALLDYLSPSPTIVYAPRPSSLRSDIVESLENIVQPTAETQLSDNLPISEPEVDACRDVVVDNGSGQGRQIIHVDAPPIRPPSRETGGPVRRVGKSKRKARRKAACTYPGCHQILSRKADLPRHWEIKHEPDSPLKNFRETGRARKWCAGCLIILSRTDSRKYLPKTGRNIASGARVARGPFQAPINGVRMKEPVATFQTPKFSSNFAHAHDQPTLWLASPVLRARRDSELSRGPKLWAGMSRQRLDSFVAANSKNLAFPAAIIMLQESLMKHIQRGPLEPWVSTPRVKEVEEHKTIPLRSQGTVEREAAKGSAEWGS
ncbi:hypothetical protein B0H16DRAFT_1690220 [Mycena metata]|uniref:C2H2-type domain-containing protein n=1 Tax=Mycena metata TaxID=1033252 RepID=A0AAD7J257_9AGAR|nr:hypothetical protein B0H16DRAFT_1690220 [Mycena metata]